MRCTILPEGVERIIATLPPTGDVGYGRKALDKECSRPLPRSRGDVRRNARTEALDGTSIATSSAFSRCAMLCTAVRRWTDRTSKWSSAMSSCAMLHTIRWRWT